MASVIPKLDDIALNVPRSGQMDIGQPNLDISGEMSEMKGNIDRQRLTQDKKELSDAKIQFQLTKIKEDSSYDNDTDLDTISERHNNGLMNGLGNASTLITNSDLRAEFIKETDVDMAISGENMRKKVQLRQHDKERGDAVMAFDEMIKAASDPVNGDIVSTMDAMELKIDSMIDSGALDNDSGNELLLSKRSEMVKGRFAAMRPAEKLEAIKEEWAIKHVPPGDLRKMKDQAEDEMKEQKALEFVLTLEDYTLEEGINLINDKYGAEKDGVNYRDYDKTMRRFLQMNQQQESIIQEDQDEVYERLFIGLESDTIDYGAISEQEKLRMSTGQLSSIMSLSDQMIKRKAGIGVAEYTDPVAREELEQMAYNGQQVNAKKFFRENLHKFSTSDRKYYHSLTQPSSKQPKFFKGIRTARNKFDALKGNMSKELQDAAWDAINNEMEVFFNNNGYEMPQSDAIKVVKTNLFQADQNPGFFAWSDDKYYFQMDSNEQKEFRISRDLALTRNPNATRDQIVAVHEGRLSAAN